MNKERQRKKHDTTPHPYLSKAGRSSKRPSKEVGKGSSPKGKIDRDTHEYMAPECADASETTPANGQKSDPKTSISYNRKNKVMSAEKRKKNRNSKFQLLDIDPCNTKTLSNHLASIPNFAYAQYVASELRKYDNQTLAYCKKEFAKVLFDADTGILLKPYHLSSNAPSNGNLKYKLKICSKHLPTDPYFVYSQYIANELRKYDHRTLAYVKKAFSEVLFEADMGTLLNSCHSRNSKHSSNIKKENEQCALPDTPPTTFLSNDKFDFQKREEWKDLFPANSETSINPFQSTDEEVDSNWEDILSDDLPTNYEDDDDSNEDTSDSNDLPTSYEEEDSKEDMVDSNTEIAEYSSPEVMRLEGRNHSDEMIIPPEFPRRTIDSLESSFIFSPKLASSKAENSFKLSGLFDRHVHQSTKMGISLENKDVNVNAPDISNFLENRKESDFLEKENSLPSTIVAPDIFNFEEYNQGEDVLGVETTSTGPENVLNFRRKEKEDAEISFITTINTEDVVDSVFKRPGEPNSPDLNEAVFTAEAYDEQPSLVSEKRRSLNGTLKDTPQSGKLITRRFFLSAGDRSNFWFPRERSTKANKSLTLQLLAKGSKKMSPKQLFIHSKLSSGELDTSMSRQSSGKYKRPRKRKVKSVRILPPNPPKPTNYSGTSKQDPYRLSSDFSELDAETSILRSRYSSLLKPRKKTPGIKSTRKNEKKESSLSPDVTSSQLSKKEVQEYADYLKTVPICPLSLQNSC